MIHLKLLFRFKSITFGPLILYVIIFGLIKVFTFSKLQKVDGTLISIASFEVGSLSFRYQLKGHHYYPVIKYYADGKEYFHMKESDFIFENYEEGDIISIIYNRENPEKSYINNLFGFWLPLPSLVFFLLLSLFWIGLIYILADSKLIK